jgi:hypothetical protein
MRAGRCGCATHRATLGSALHEFSTVREARGEICLLVEGAPSAGDAAGDAAHVERVLRELLASGMPVSGAVKEVWRLAELVPCAPLLLFFVAADDAPALVRRHAW